MTSEADRPVSRPTYDALFGDPVDEPERARDPGPEHDAPPSAPPTLVDPGALDDPIAERPAAPLAPAEPAAAAAAAPDTGWHGDPEQAARAARPVDTGRLYHSAGASGPATSDAIPALPARPPAVEPPVEAPVEAPAEAPRFVSHPPTREPAPASAARASAVAAQAPPATARDDRGLTYLGVIAVVAAPTFLVGLAQGVLANRIGWLTGLTLLLTSCYAAVTVRRPDFAAAIVIPPLAFFGTTLIAGQLTLEGSGSLLVREGFMIFRTLAENAPWVLGATAAAAVIVLVRRRRAD